MVGQFDKDKYTALTGHGSSEGVLRCEKYLDLDKDKTFLISVLGLSMLCCREAPYCVRIGVSPGAFEKVVVIQRSRTLA